MLMLARAVRRGLQTPLLVGDMPFGSYELSNEQAIANAQRFIKEAGCDAVKLERGGASVERARAIVRRRDPGDGPRRPDAADGDRARRLQGPGPHRPSRARRSPRTPSRSRPSAASRSSSRRCPPPSTEAIMPRMRDPGDRDRRRLRHRRPGPRLPRPARHLRRATGPLREALRRHPRRDGRRRRAPTPPRSATAASRTPSTPTPSTRDELAALERYLEQDTLAGSSPWDW